MARQWHDERYLHYIHHNNTTNRYQLACWHDQTMARREVSTLHTSQQHSQPVPTCWNDQTMARREVSTLQTLQQHNQPVPTCWHGQTMARREVSTLHLASPATGRQGGLKKPSPTRLLPGWEPIIPRDGSSVYYLNCQTGETKAGIPAAVVEVALPASSQGSSQQPATITSIWLGSRHACRWVGSVLLQPPHSSDTS